jgi:hypothetical protein
MFNPEEFLDMQVTESNSTKTTPVPAGEFLGLADEVKVLPWQKKDDPSVGGLKLEISWNIDDANVKATLERDKVTCRQQIMLDLTESGGLDMGKGKNVGLGRLREAIGLNTPGQPFSFSMIPGRLAKVKVEHRVDGENIYAEIKGVTKYA